MNKPLGAFNVRGAHLVRDDFIERDIEGERLDGGDHSRVAVRVANVLPYTVLKTLAFQDRHENKDAYDLVFTLLNHEGGPQVNHEGGPQAAGCAAAGGAAAEHPQAIKVLALLEERLRDAGQDGPSAYASFLATTDEEKARLRQEAVTTVRGFLRRFRGGGRGPQ